jgi:hypothetical protein
MQAELDFVDENGETIPVTVDFTVTKHKPATMYGRHGNPGEPEEGGELDIHGIWGSDGEWAVDGKGRRLHDSDIIEQFESVLYEMWDTRDEDFYPFDEDDDPGSSRGRRARTR